MSNESRFVVAVTGAQGVGKSTFCGRLLERLRPEAKHDTALLDGLGERINALGIPLGSDSTTQTIAAVFTAHLEREASAPYGLVILDRCVVDALAYSRALGIGSNVEIRLYEQVAKLAAARIKFVVHLGLSTYFAGKGGTHETPALRAQVAENIPIILAEFQLPHLNLDAATDDAVEQAASAILKRIV